MKTFLLFAGDNYYPCGGARDLQGAYETLDAALHARGNLTISYDWWHVYDLTQGRRVAGSVGETN